MLCIQTHHLESLPEGGKMSLPMMLLQTQGGGQGPSSLMMWMPIVLIFVIMYFLILRPQAKRQKEHQAMLNALQKGDDVVTAGGIYGTIVGVKEKEQTLIVKIADNVKVEIARSGIARKLTPASSES
jgi:preprotein translocase subunit YajC